MTTKARTATKAVSGKPLARLVRHIAPNLRPLAVSIDRLRENPANARAHDDRSVAALTADLGEFGQQKPIVTDARGVVAAGNGTLAAARQLGWQYVAAVKSNLKGHALTAYAIADNRTADLSTFDDQILRDQLATLAAEADDGLLHAAGYSPEDLAEMLGEDDADETAEDLTVPETWMVSVEVASEAEQRRLCEMLKKKGYDYKCQTL